MKESLIDAAGIARELENEIDVSKVGISMLI